MLFEDRVIKARSSLLLVDTHVSEDANHHVEVERHATFTDGHKVKHTSSVEVLVTELERLDVDSGYTAINAL